MFLKKITSSHDSYAAYSQPIRYEEKLDELISSGFHIHNQRASILCAIKDDSEKPANQAMHLRTATFRPINQYDLWGRDVNVKIRATIPAPHPAPIGDMIANLTAEREGKEPEEFSTYLTAQDLAVLSAFDDKRHKGLQLHRSNARSVGNDELRAKAGKFEIEDIRPMPPPALAGTMIVGLAVKREGERDERFGTVLNTRQVAYLARQDLSRAGFSKGEAKKILRQTGPYIHSPSLSYRMFRKMEMEKLVEQGQVRLDKELSHFEKIGRLQGGALASVFVTRGDKKEKAHVLLDHRELGLLLQAHKKDMLQSLKQLSFKEEEAENIAEAVLLYRNYQSPEGRFSHDQFRPLQEEDLALLTDAGVKRPGLVATHVFPVDGEYSVVKLVDRRGSVGKRSSEWETHSSDSESSDADGKDFVVYMPAKKAMQIMRAALRRKEVKMEKGAATFTEADVDTIMTVIDGYRNHPRLEQRLDHNDFAPFNHADLIKSGSRVTFDSQLAETADGRVLGQVMVTQGDFIRRYHTVLSKQQATMVSSTQMAKSQIDRRDRILLENLELRTGASDKDAKLRQLQEAKPFESETILQVAEKMEEIQSRQQQLRSIVYKFAAQYTSGSQDESQSSDIEDWESDGESRSVTHDVSDDMYDHDSSESELE